CRLSVQQYERLADCGVTQAGEPSGVRVRQTVEVAPQSLDKQHFGQLVEHQIAARGGSACLVHGKADRVLDPCARGSSANVDTKKGRQASQKDLAEPGFAGHEAADEACDFTAAAEAGRLESLG